MYLPEIYAENDRATLLDLIRTTGWGYLVGAADGVPFATHLPFMLEGEPGAERLVAHVARANPHWKSFAEGGREQLVIFAGPHVYVSPRWNTTAKAVPTWNYVTVHVYGVPRIVDDPAAVHAAQTRLVDFYEAGAAAPWRMEDVDAGFIEGMLRAIVSFEIPIARLEGKYKLSQNRKAEDRAGVIAALADGPDDGGQKIARLMASREAGLLSR